MCSYITVTEKIVGSAKGGAGWMKVDTAHVYFDHPFHAQLDHALAIDFVNEAAGAKERVAIEISAASARALIRAIEHALATGAEAHGAAVGEDEPELLHY